MLVEEWKDINGFEGFYQISTMGRVRSLDRVVHCGYGKCRKERGRLLKLAICKSNGYFIVVLRRDNKPKTCLVHRLVADAFILNTNDLPEVNHKDENKLNNNVTNLEWCTHKYNQNYGTHNQRMSNTKQGISLLDAHKNKISISLKKAYAEGRRHYRGKKLKNFQKRY